jgi:hypothetical protein
VKNLAIALVLVGCSPAMKDTEADAAYAAEHLHCVDKYNTRQEIDACRAGVRLRWGIAEKVADAGADR